MKLALGIIAAIAFLMVCTLLPFLPGSYDPLALPLSMMARMFGFTGLLLVPIGALWTAARYSPALAARQYALAIAALIAGSIVWMAGSLAAVGVGSVSFAFFTAVAGAAIFAGLLPRVRRLMNAPGWSGGPALFLVVVPLTVFSLQRAVLEPAVTFSRSRAIRNSASLIADIEQYRAARGHYPPSLLAVHRDYKPEIIGIDRFHYEPSGAAYNVLFEQPAVPIGTREIVVYNPRDEQVATGHAMDILQYTPEHLERTRGYYAVHAGPQPHWRYFWFD